MIESGTVGAIATGGLSALSAGLVSITIPKDRVLSYERAVKGGKYLLTLRGTRDEVDQARNLLDDGAVAVAGHARAA